jgi:hypothetical protein
MLFEIIGWGGCIAPQGESTPLAREIQLMLLAVDTRAPIAVAIVGTAAASGTGDNGAGGAASAGTKRGDKGIAVDRAWVKNKVRHCSKTALSSCIAISALQPYNGYLLVLFFWRR